MSDTENMLFEIGVEELPASYVDKALMVLPDLFEKRLAQARLTHAGIRALGTPRRLTVFVYDLATQQPDLSEAVTGPPIRIAFDKEGKPTKAALAFAKKLGCEIDDLERVESPKGIYLAGIRQEAGRSTIDLLGAMLTEICGAIPFRKSMRWSDGETAFGRPVRWLVALYGSQVIDMSFAGVRSGRVTQGHRFLAPEPIEIPDPEDYVELLREAHVVVDPSERGERMMERLREACEEAGTTLVEDDFLRHENLNLVEEPHVITGSFDEAFLALPEDVIVAVAKGHQRYFCARREDGELAPMYLSVAGTALKPDIVRLGNDRVMRARLSDARFFYEEDMKVRLESRFEQLAGIVFQKRLGSVRDKVQRVERLVEVIGAALGMDAETIGAAKRGAHLCKCDLASLMVGEFPELQGEMGAAYALGQGESEAVAAVISGHYQPKGASDATPDNDAAALVGIADRLDTLVGCFAVGLIPTGAADPYALRRACLGVLRTLLDRGYGLVLSGMFESTYAGFEGVKLDASAEQTTSKLLDFFRDRLRGLLVERYPHDVVDACLAAGHGAPTDVRDRVIALAGLEATMRSKAGEVFKRATNISKDAPEGRPVDPSQVGMDVHETEIAVYRALGDLDGRLDHAQKTRDFPAAFAAIADFAPLLVAFFENVFVLDDDTAIRENRLRLMRSISERCSGIAHFNMLT
jgi:glycyl-tRNA synthetase beta chain